MNRTSLTIALCLFPSLAYASEGGREFFIFSSLIVAGVLGGIAFLLTKPIVNCKVKCFLRTIPFTLLLSPSIIGGDHNFFPSGLIFLFGESEDRLLALVPVIVFTTIVYYFLKAAHKCKNA